jgi:hypothetical protein
MNQPLSYADLHTDTDIVHRELPDGSIRIRVRPMGWLKAIGYRGKASLIVGMAIAGIGGLSPFIVVGYRYVHGYDKQHSLAFLIMGSLAMFAVVSVMFAVFRDRAMHTIELTVGPKGLTFWASGPFDPRNKAWPIEEIQTVDVDVKTMRDETTMPYLRVKLRDGEYELLSDRPREQLNHVAALCRQGLALGR